MLIEKENKELELKKHVGSIHCSNTLSLLQRKISNVLLYHAFDELLDKEEHAITIKTLCGLIGYSSHDYDSIKKALKALISTVIEWNLLGDNKNSPRQDEDWNASSILASVGIKSGLCTYSYSHRLKKLLFMPEIYGRINIAIQSKFKSNYALALYENCVRYQNLPHTRWFDLATFRKLMGVPDNKYQIFRDFKRRVLDKSVEEVNLYADIQVEPEIERQGHQVMRIRFKLIRTGQLDNKINPQEATVSQNEDSILYQLTQSFGFSAFQAQKTIQDFGIDYVNDKIAVVKTSPAFTQKRVKNTAAYLKSALNEDYKAKPIQESRSKPKDEEGAEEDRRRHYSEFVGDLLDQTYEQFDLSTQERLLEDFEKYLKSSNNFFILEKYAQKGLQNRIVKSIFRTYLREQQVSLLPPITSFEQFTVEEGDNK